jgi:hypothetical protein
MLKSRTMKMNERVEDKSPGIFTLTLDVASDIGHFAPEERTPSWLACCSTSIRGWVALIAGRDAVSPTLNQT